MAVYANAEAVAVDKDSPSSESADRPADRSSSYYCIHPPTRRLKGSGRYAGGDGRRWYRVEARKEHSRRHLAIEEAGGRQRKGKSAISSRGSSEKRLAEECQAIKSVGARG